jgi:hypothetical protein
MPELVDEKDVKPLVEDLAKKYENNPALMHCVS